MSLGNQGVDWQLVSLEFWLGLGGLGSRSAGAQSSSWRGRVQMMSALTHGFHHSKPTSWLAGGALAGLGVGLCGLMREGLTACLSQRQQIDSSRVWLCVCLEFSLHWLHTQTDWGRNTKQISHLDFYSNTMEESVMAKVNSPITNRGIIICFWWNITRHGTNTSLTSG